MISFLLFLLRTWWTWRWTAITRRWRWWRRSCSSLSVFIISLSLFSPLLVLLRSLSKIRCATFTWYTLTIRTWRSRTWRAWWTLSFTYMLIGFTPSRSFLFCLIFTSLFFLIFFKYIYFFTIVIWLGRISSFILFFFQLFFINDVWVLPNWYLYERLRR